MDTMQEPEIIFEDDILMVCYKPAGIAVQTKKLGQKDMESILRNHIALAGGKTGKGGLPYIGIVHRLDQPVEGVMVFAKTPQGAASLSAQVQKHSLGKKYYAVVRLPENQSVFSEVTGLPDRGTLEDWILFEPKKNISRIVPKGTPGAKRALLDYRVAGQCREKVLLDITLHTGRHHQIRLQLANMGTPILGDRKYGHDTQGSLSLCSYHIDFEHPLDSHKMNFDIVPENKQFEQFETAVKTLTI